MIRPEMLDIRREKKIPLAGLLCAIAKGDANALSVGRGMMF